MYKDRFPFSFSVPSYIIPANIKENLIYLKDKVDEVELILFEGNDYSNMPTSDDIIEFKTIAEDGNLRFNTHLPIDISVTSEKSADRKKALDTINRTIELDI